MLLVALGLSGESYDFFAFDANGKVWHPASSSFVDWVDANFASYRIAATETGSTGRFTATAPAGTERYEMRFRGVTLDESFSLWEERTLNSIETQTAKIGSGMAIAVSRVSPAGNVTIEQGIDDTGTGRITIREAGVGDWDHDADAIAAPEFAFRAEHKGHGKSADGAVQVAATLEAADGDGLRSFTVEIPREDKPTRLGIYTYGVAGVLADGDRRSIVGGTLVLEAGAWAHAS